MKRRVISEFQGEYRFLSNFWMTPVTHEGRLYPSSEHAYMAAKTLDPALRASIAQAPTPYDAKAIGKTIRLRKDWEIVKFEVMVEILRSKFLNPLMGSKLLATGNAILQKGNWHNDTVWGICLKTGEGQNLLGQALTLVREELRPLADEFARQVKAIALESTQEPARQEGRPEVKVVNLHTGGQGEYIGRGSPLGNKVPVGSEGREVAIARYKVWLTERLAAGDEKVRQEMNRLYQLAKKTGSLNLCCFCAPKACHGDVIRDLLLAKYDQHNSKEN